jgi:acyl-CoA thioester hydrolase
LLRDAGFPLRQVEANGFVYPIFQLGLDYFRPLDYDDPMWIHTRFRELRPVTIDFDYLITHAETGVVLCRGFTRHCATNRKGRPVAVDPSPSGSSTTFPCDARAAHLPVTSPDLAGIGRPRDCKARPRCRPSCCSI